MAKWGERDPRWLVEHREDGKNVNGWHWEEKDRKEWTKGRLAELFSGLVLYELEDSGEGEPFGLKVERLKDMTGDASITTRKGNRRFAVFDMTVVLGWEGSVAGSSTMVKGDMRIEEVHSTGDEDDYVYLVTVEGSGDAQTKLKALASSNAIKAKVYATLSQCIEELREQV